MIRVVAALIEKKGRLLICQRRRGSLFGLQWEFPGGKLRAKEAPQAGLARELKEELGSTAQIGAEVYRTRYRYQEHASPVDIRFFHVRELSPGPRNLVFERMVWARPEDLTKYDFLPADEPLVARLARKQVLLPSRPQTEHARVRRGQKTDSSLRSE